jgi:hypothetical protein
VPDYQKILDYQTCTDRRLGSSVGITTGYRLDGPGSNPGGSEIFHTCPDWLWGPPSLLYNVCPVFLGGRKQPGHDTDPSPSTSAQV